MLKSKLRILVVQPGDLGDMCVLTGVIDGLKKKFTHSNIYVACKKQFMEVWNNNPNIKGVVEYHESMNSYRNYIKEGINAKAPFDAIFHPYSTTQIIPSNWICGGGCGRSLGEHYAAQCGVEYGSMFLEIDESFHDKLKQSLIINPDDPWEYITIQGNTSKNVKDYQYYNDVLDHLQHIRIFQIGSAKDKLLDNPNLIDLRGKTTLAQSLGLLKNAKMHIGGDSACLHMAAYTETPQIVLFGGTNSNCAISPWYKNVHIIETPDYGICVSPCHYSDCEQEKMGLHRCIDNIPVAEVLNKIEELLGKEYIIDPDPVKLSAYIILKDGIKYQLPFEQCIKAAVKICDEVVIVDGGSTDNTLNKLKELSGKFNNLKVFEHEWDMSNFDILGLEKTFALQKCTGTHAIQLDADEILYEPYDGAIKKLVTDRQFDHVITLPVVNFYKDKRHIRLDPNVWKWRILRTDLGLQHTVHKQARKYDQNTGQLVFDKKITDGCEVCYKNFELVKHKHGFNAEIMIKHAELGRVYQMNKDGEMCANKQKEYIEVLRKLIQNSPCTFHLSWLDLERKKNAGEFWDNTAHGKIEQTHNTTNDIKNRIENNKEIVIEVGDLFNGII